MTAALLFDPGLVRRYDRPGPRYTSYPSALQFNPRFTQADYAAAVRRSNGRGGALSVYVHVPFCESPCFFCACNKLITRQQAMAVTYVARLQQEIALQAALFARRGVRQLHFGGGTPTFLGTAQIASILAALDRAFGLEASTGREFSIEIDPRRLGPETLAELAALGFNRLSLGVQDFDPEVQEAVNRRQSVEQTAAAVCAARRAGFASLAMDLICGLPRQTPGRFARTLDTLVALQPDRVSLYSYAHLPQRFKAQRRLPAQDLPSAAVKLELMQLAVQRLTDAGYVHIGMDHFARPQDPLSQALRSGGLQRNFQGYSTGGGLDLIGLGVSAIGQVDGCYSQNAKTLGDYYGRLDQGRLPIERGLVPSAEDRLRAAVIAALMCGAGIDYAEFARTQGIDFGGHFARELAALAPMAADGLVRLLPQRLEVAERGRYLLRAIAMCFDAYAAPADGAVHHSRLI